MRIIGKIQLGNDESRNDYVGGAIVELTEVEIRELAHLQSAIDNNNWNYSGAFPEIDERDMSPVFMAIYHFVVTRYAINNLQSTLDTLRDFVMLAKNNEDLPAA